MASRFVALLACTVAASPPHSDVVVAPYASQLHHPAGFVSSANGIDGCEHLPSCHECLSNRDCGWCASTETCLEGVVMGPLGSKCDAWDYGMCSHSQPCSARRACGECERDPACGWCPATQQCTEGNADGPLFGHCADWQHGSELGVACSRGPPHANEQKAALVVPTAESAAKQPQQRAGAKQHDVHLPPATKVAKVDALRRMKGAGTSIHRK